MIGARVSAKLRQLCLDTLEGYEEVMDYGMPGYKKNGVGEVGFASQKNYISLYILKEPVIAAHRAQFAGLSVGNRSPLLEAREDRFRGRRAAADRDTRFG